jgi:tetratricopeptide (TPR) repeat protein
MRRLLVSAIIGFELLLAAGCGTRTPSALPAEYRTLATQLVSELKASPDEFRDNKDMSELLAEGHSAIIAMRGLKSSDQDIMYIANQGQLAFTDAMSHLERINALPKPPSAGVLLVNSFVDGFFGNVFGGYARGTDADNKQNAITAELHLLKAAIDKGEAAQQMLPRIAERYSSPFCTSTGRILLNFDEAWGSFGPNHWFSIGNMGPALEDCTILVQLTGANGGARRSVYFVQKWSANSWMHARFQPADLPSVEQIAVTIWSPKFSTLIEYKYSGAERDKDIASRCEKLTIHGRYRPFAEGIVWNDERAAILTLDGVALIPKCTVNVAFVRGSNITSCTWNLDFWKEHDAKTFATVKGQLPWDPEKMIVSIAFPNSSYQWRREIPVAQSSVTPPASILSKSDRQKAENAYGRGISASDNGDFDLAINCFTETVRLMPDDPNAYYCRGNAYRDKSDFEKAIVDYTVAIRLKPDFAWAYGNRGATYFSTNDFDRSIADNTEAIRLEPGNANSYLGLGNSWLKKSDINKAIACYTEAIRLKPDLADAHYNRGVAYAKINDMDKAIADSTEAIRLEPGNVEAYFSRAIDYTTTNDFGKAIADCTEAIRLKPSYAAAYFSRGIAYERSGDIRKAKLDYDKATQLGHAPR